MNPEVAILYVVTTLASAVRDPLIKGQDIQYELWLNLQILNVKAAVRHHILAGGVRLHVLQPFCSDAGNKLFRVSEQVDELILHEASPQAHHCDQYV